MVEALSVVAGIVCTFAGAWTLYGRETPGREIERAILAELAPLKAAERARAGHTCPPAPTPCRPCIARLEVECGIGSVSPTSPTKGTP